MILLPGENGIQGELGTVIADDHAGATSDLEQAIELPYDPGAVSELSAYGVNSGIGAQWQGTAQMRLIDGFGQIFVAPCIETGRHVFGVGFRGHEDDGH